MNQLQQLQAEARGLMSQGLYAQAADAYLRLSALDPRNPEPLVNHGAALGLAGRHEEALEVFRRATEANPALPAAWMNLARAFRDLNRLEEAIEAYRRGVAVDPNWPNGHFNLALALLGAGQMPEGWREYEWRFKLPGRGQGSAPGVPWDGSDPTGKRLFLWAEQGFGDVIQFIRYADEAAARGAEVLVGVQPELRRLIARSKSIKSVHLPAEPLGKVDLQAPLCSVPRIIQTTLETIPARVPYLHTDEQAVARWLERLNERGAAGQLKVGLTWFGRQSNREERHRSISLQSLSGLGQLPGVSYVSLQKGTPPAAREGALRIIDFTEELNDFADTADLIGALDLVISVETAVAHLAGALGKPVWVPLAHVADWRWMRERPDSPWYPTMRLFRQSDRGRWDDVMERIRAELVRMTAPAEAPAKAPQSRGIMGWFRG